MKVAINQDFVGGTLYEFLSNVVLKDEITISSINGEVPGFIGRVNQVPWYYAHYTIKYVEWARDERPGWYVEIV